MLIPGNDYPFEVQIKSPMGWIKVQGTVTLQSETELSGQAKLLGFTVPLTDCMKEGSHLTFVASPKLPFGVLRVEITADVSDDGTVTGIANAPRHKPMEIKGQLMLTAASAAI